MNPTDDILCGIFLVESIRKTAGILSHTYTVSQQFLTPLLAVLALEGRKPVVEGL